MKRGTRATAKIRAQKVIANEFPIVDTGTYATGPPNNNSVTEIAKLQFVPSTATTIDYFEGLKIDGRKSEVVTLLSPKWVKDVFAPKYVDMVERAGRLVPTKLIWIDVPVGNARLDEAPSTIISAAVKMKYRQNDKSSCLFKSCASAFHHVNHKPTGNAISSVALKYNDYPAKEQMEQVWKIVHTLHPTARIQRWYSKKRAEKLDILNHINHNVTIVIPLGTDGGVEHGVTIVDNLVFDSTQRNALVLCKDTLDWCCNNGENGYKGVYMAVEFSIPLK